MNDTLFMRGLQCFSNLLRDRQSLMHRNRTALDPRLQRLALDQLHDDAPRPGGFFDAVNVRDVRMIQRRQHLSLTAEPRQAFAVGSERRRQQLDRDATAKLGVGCLIDFTHAAGSQVARDLVMCDSGSDHVLTKMPGRSYQRPLQIFRDLQLSGEWFGLELLTVNRPSLQ